MCRRVIYGIVAKPKNETITAQSDICLLKPIPAGCSAQYLAPINATTLINTTDAIVTLLGLTEINGLSLICDQKLKPRRTETGVGSPCKLISTSRHTRRGFTLGIVHMESRRVSSNVGRTLSCTGRTPADYFSVIKFGIGCPDRHSIFLLKLRCDCRKKSYVSISPESALATIYFSPS